MTYNKVVLAFLIYFSLCVWPHVVDGKVILDNGESYEGKLAVYPAIHFRDFVRGHYIRLSLKDIAQIDVLDKLTRPYSIRQPEKYPEIYKESIVAITTWQGERYWGIKNFRVIVKKNNRKKKFVIPKKQKKLPGKSRFIKKVICSSKIFSSYPKHKTPALYGKIKIKDVEVKGLFQKAYALNYQLGMFFVGKINQDQYFFENLIPGNYDLFFVTKKGIIFGASMPPRKSMRDLNVQRLSAALGMWVKKTLRKNNQLRYYVGYHSNTRAIVLESNPRPALWFWLCSKRAQIWTLKNRFLLYQTKSKKDRIPRLLFDRKLMGILVPLRGGTQKYNYIVEN